MLATAHHVHSGPLMALAWRAMAIFTAQVGAQAVREPLAGINP